MRASSSPAVPEAEMISLIIFGLQKPEKLVRDAGQITRAELLPRVCDNSGSASEGEEEERIGLLNLLKRPDGRGDPAFSEDWVVQ
jgi:hypothetical protein